MNISLSLLEDEMNELTRSNWLGAKFPPNCFLTMKGEFLEYESRSSLTVSFPALEDSLNPLRVMQGGFIVAAFDNVFGPLSYLAAKYPCVTLTLDTHFIRSVGPGDRLIIRARVISRSLHVLHLSGEAFNSKNKLIATASATASIAKIGPSAES